MATPGPQLWRALNVLQRIAGMGAAGTGAVFGVWAILQLSRPSVAMAAQRFSDDPRLGHFAVLAFAGVLFFLAAILLRARPFRPDLGDSLTSVNEFRSSRPSEPSRRWWTGDPIDPS